MATLIPTALTFFAVFIIVSVSGDTSECTLSHSNIVIISQFIDARINAAVNVAVTAATVEEEFNAAVDERIAATVNTTFSALTASADERIRAVNTTISALNVKAARSICQPGEVVQCIMSIYPIISRTFDFGCVSNFEANLVCLLPPALDQCG